MNIVISLRYTNRLLLIATLGFFASAARAQSPVDSSWVLEHGDSLLFHHDATLEYVRTNGNREIRFPDHRRLYFFTPDRYITPGAFQSRNFQQVNAVATPARSDIRFRLAPGYTSPSIVWASFPEGTPYTISPNSTSNNREYRFAVAFVEPGWHVVEISANGPGHMVHIIARVIVCVGDHLPLPFDTVVERRGPASFGRSDERISTFLTYDRERAPGTLRFDSTHSETASILVAAASAEGVHWATISPQRTRRILGSVSSQCDSAVSAVIIAEGNTTEALAWNLWTSPTHRSLELLKKANRVSVAVMRTKGELLGAIMIAVEQ